MPRMWPVMKLVNRGPGPRSLYIGRESDLDKFSGAGLQEHKSQAHYMCL